MKRNKMLLVAAGLALVVALGFMLAMSSPRLHSKARKQWKNEAIQDIAKRVSDDDWVKSELLRIREKMAQAGENSDAWYSGHMVVATNGEWLVFSSKCSKEDRRIHDIFIGRGSDGKWYFSTFHFCVRMLSLQMEDQPADLATFVSTYFLREFDGQSDECLKMTWPPKKQ
jgi:hypothetical protein